MAIDSWSNGGQLTDWLEVITDILWDVFQVMFLLCAIGVLTVFMGIGAVSVFHRLMGG